MKDSAGYGSVTITKAINIVGDGSLAGVLASPGGNAIQINAGASDRITLRGLTIEGAGVGSNGIVFNSGGALDVANCVIQNFVGTAQTVGNGLLLQPMSGSIAFTITDTNLSHNARIGLYYYPPAGSSAASSLVIEHIVATDNLDGVAITPPYTSGATVATLSNSVMSKNTSNGIYLTGASLKADIDLCRADQNAFYGYFIFSGTVTIGRSVAANNGLYGVFNNVATVSSYGDNRFAGNGNGATSGTIGIAALH